MKRLLLAIITAVLFAGCVNINKLIDCENPKAWDTDAKLNTQIKRSGKYSFETFGKYPTKTIFKNFIPINPKKTYTLTCYMRSLDPKQPASGYMGLYMYDKDKKLIAYNQVRVMEGTESELLQPAIKGSTVIIIKNNPKCIKAKNWRIAFNAKDKYADLPSYDLSPRGKTIKVAGNKLKLILRSPLEKAYEAGTKIRLHSTWGAPFYWGAKGWMPGKWKKFTVIMKGISTHGTTSDQFWKGTKYVKPFIWFGNWNKIPKAEARLLIDDFTFTESK